MREIIFDSESPTTISLTFDEYEKLITHYKMVGEYERDKMWRKALKKFNYKIPELFIPEVKEPEHLGITIVYEDSVIRVILEA